MYIYTYTYIYVYLYMYIHIYVWFYQEFKYVLTLETTTLKRPILFTN